MNAIDQVAHVLGSIPSTPKEKRAAKNRRYYERTRDVSEWRWKIRRLINLRDILVAT